MIEFITKFLHFTAYLQLLITSNCIISVS